jgi:hypothetical protein
MSLFDLYYPNNSDSICEDIDFNPKDNDPAQVETISIRALIKSEPDDDEDNDEWDGESEPPKSYTPEGDDYVQGGLR